MVVDRRQASEFKHSSHTLTYSYIVYQIAERFQILFFNRSQIFASQREQYVINRIKERYDRNLQKFFLEIRLIFLKNSCRQDIVVLYLQWTWGYGAVGSASYLSTHPFFLLHFSKSCSLQILLSFPFLGIWRSWERELLIHAPLFSSPFL